MGRDQTYRTENDEKQKKRKAFHDVSEARPCGDLTPKQPRREFSWYFGNLTSNPIRTDGPGQGYAQAIG